VLLNIIDFAKKEQQKIFILSPFKFDNTLFNDNQYIKNCSPVDFLSFTYYANYIFTDSFHGTAFSILLEKNFTVFTRASKNNNNKEERVINLLSTFNLLDNYSTECINIKNIDYFSVLKILKREKKASEKFLLDAFKELYV
jgi:hypothetical protein